MMNTISTLYKQTNKFTNHLMPYFYNFLYIIHTSFTSRNKSLVSQQIFKNKPEPDFFVCLQIIIYVE